LFGGSGSSVLVASASSGNGRITSRRHPAGVSEAYARCIQVQRYA